MTTREADFVLVIDPRFPGGTSSALIDEIAALGASLAPDRVAIFATESGLFGPDAAPNEALTQVLAATPIPFYRIVGGALERFDRELGDWGPPDVEALRGRYAVVHNPYVALTLHTLPEGVLAADVALIVAHQPYLDGAGIPYYALSEMLRGAEAIAPIVRIAPIGILSRRNLLRAGWITPHIAPFDWPNVFDFSRFEPGEAPGESAPAQPLLRIGRHSRGDWVKWPERKADFARIYQHGTAREVHFLGWGKYCREMFAEDTPANWHTLGFNEVPVPDFLRRIDLFVYYYHRNWTEGFGRTVPEALAAGVPCLLTPRLAPTFRGLALYAGPGDVTALLRRLDHRREALAAFAAAGRAIATEAFSPDRIAEIYTILADAPAAAFEEAAARIATRQAVLRGKLDAGYEAQVALGLSTEQEVAAYRRAADADEAPAPEPAAQRALRPAPDPERASLSVDLVFCMDLRSARSDAWRLIELAEAAAASGRRVAIVHVETRSKVDFTTGFNPLFDEISPAIALVGGRDGPPVRSIDAQDGAVVAAPHHLVADDGSIQFADAPRIITPAALVIADRRKPADWYVKADSALALLLGVRPAWLSTSTDRKEMVEAGIASVEEILPVAFVARRPFPLVRDLRQRLLTPFVPRRGRIGLMDASQWRELGSTVAEDVPQGPIFAYGMPHGRLAPATIQGRADFFEFRAGDVSFASYLEKISYITYYPSPKPNDLQLIPVLRAITSGVLAIVDGNLKRYLGNTAIYAREDALGETLEKYWSDPQRTTRTALSKAREATLSHDAGRALALVDRALAARRPDLRTRPAARGAARRPVNGAASPDALNGFPLAAENGHDLPLPALGHAPEEREVLFFSSNGVGLGHLTRLMSIARRVSRAKPVFATMSQAFPLVKAAGWPVKYIPFHEVSGCNVADWNEWLSYELSEIVRRRPRIAGIVFDGSNPYSGLMSTAADRRLPRIWVQRGMWRKGHMNQEHVRRGKNFDLIVEPSDIAESMSEESVESPGFDKVKIDPIWLLDPHEILGRDAARKTLGLPRDQQICLVQLGSGVNRDVVQLLDRIVPELARRKIVICIAEWLMGSEIPRLWREVRYLRVFPLAKYFRAFDFCISAAGYNSFHELIGYEVPTIFVANDHQVMDDQGARAEFAMQNDAAIRITEEDVPTIGGYIDLIAQEETKVLMREGCAAIATRNGAATAARIIEEMTA